MTTAKLHPDRKLLAISPRVAIPSNEIQIVGIRSAGPGGQNVNKVSSAVQLRFDVPQSSLPEPYKRRIMQTRDRRISKDGVLIIKAQKFRSHEKNRQDALLRLQELIRSACLPRRRRIATQPSRAAAQRRLDRKTRRGQLKRLRAKPVWQDS